MKKRYLAITLAIVVTMGGIAQPLMVSAATDDEEAQALAPLEELTAGGFYVKENSYVDAENNSFFITDTKQKAAQVIDAYDLDAETCAISEEMGDSVVVQTDLTDRQKSWKPMRVFHRWRVTIWFMAAPAKPMGLSVTR